MADQIHIDTSGKPKAEEQTAPPGFDPTPLLEKIDRVKDGVALLEKKVEFIATTNQLVVIVLFIAVVALIIAAFTSSANTQSELTRSINRLSNDVNSLRWTIHSSSSTESGHLEP